MIYGRLATAFGWSWEYIDQYVTLPMLAEVQEYWDVVPPLAESIADIWKAFGGKAAPTTTRQTDAGGEAAAGDDSALVAELVRAGLVVPPPMEHV